MHFRSKKLMRSAEGQSCVLCGVVGLTVAAHANYVEYGKGKGIKCPDCLICFVCDLCHALIDGRAGNLSKM